MNYIFVLKEEKTESIKKFNKIKKWFISNSYIKIENQSFFIYENNIDILAPYFLNFYMIAPNVFPMLNSCILHHTLKQKNVICDDVAQPIIFLDLKEPIKIDNIEKNISFDLFYSSIQELPTRVNGLIKKYNYKNINQREWFYIEDEQISNFLLDMKRKYFI
jgi:hypothetical protein